MIHFELTGKLIGSGIRQDEDGSIWANLMAEIDDPRLIRPEDEPCAVSCSVKPGVVLPTMGVRSVFTGVFYRGKFTWMDRANNRKKVIEDYRFFITKASPLA